jgi:hypothetical protein
VDFGDFIAVSGLASDREWNGHGHSTVSFEAQADESANPPTDKAPDNGCPARRS